MRETKSIPRASDAEDGIALIMTLIFSVLLYALVADLVTTARTARLTGENAALTARMDNHMTYCLGKVEDMLLADLTASAAAGDDSGMGGLGGLPGEGGGILPGAGGAGDLPTGEGEGEEAETDPSAECDGSRDAWYEPTAYADNDITTYVWVEDENAKFNIHTLVSPDDEFALESRERFVRLIDNLRVDTDFDLTASDGEVMADSILDWLRSRVRTQELPRPRLKSDTEFDRSDVSLMLHLDELLLLRGIDRDLFFDKVLDGRLIHGLESVLTIYTSNRFDPGDPDDPRTQPEPDPDDPEAGGEEATEPEAVAGPDDPPPQPHGVGIRININTAPRPVLRALFDPVELPDSVLDAILRWRNEAVEDDFDLTDSAMPDDYLGLVESGQQVERNVFTSLDQLEDIPEFMNLPDTTVKDRMYQLCGVDSDVFSVHMASMHIRNDERRVFVLRRRRSVLVRIDDGGDGVLHPLILLEARNGLRVKGVDFPDESELDRFARNDAMDSFSQEEQAWNPFLLDFYLPDEERDRLYSYR